MYQETFKEIITEIFKKNNNEPITESELFSQPLLLKKTQQDKEEDLSVLRLHLEQLVKEHYLKQIPPNIQKPDTYQLVKMPFSL